MIGLKIKDLQTCFRSRFDIFRDAKDARKKNNSLNLMRLFLATLVITAHSYPIGGWVQPIQAPFGGWAVFGFFGISGYLIAISRERSRTLRQFLFRRVFRIYPAFYASLIFTAFIAAPLSVFALDSGEYSLSDAFGYVPKNATLYIVQGGVGGSLDDAIYPFAWNGSLWSLAIEFLCYLTIGIGYSIVPTKFRRALIALTLVVATALSLGIAREGGTLIAFTDLVAAATAFFFAGAFIYEFRSWIPNAKSLTILSVVLTALLSPHGDLEALAALPLSFALLSVSGNFGNSKLSRLATKSDISYGMYIFAFPVQQLLSLSGLPGVLTPFTFALLHRHHCTLGSLELEAHRIPRCGICKKMDLP